MEKPLMVAHSSSLKGWLIVIPARLHSTRLPKKPLQLLAGKPLITRVYANLAPLKNLGAEVVVATEAEEVLSVCKSHSIPCVLTSAAHTSGTDRCAEVATKHDAAFIVNVQGDEPFVQAPDIERLIHAMQADETADIGTLAWPSSDPADFANPNVVKAIRAKDDSALYFTRASSPFPRNQVYAQKNSPLFWHHIGVYAFRRAKLDHFCRLSPSHLEQLEQLEQLRALENKMRILIVTASQKTQGIDTPEDLEAANKKF